jgi:hypothetical protein
VSIPTYAAAGMGWLEDLTHPIIGRVWMAFLGYGHVFEVAICTDEHLEVLAFSGDDPIQEGDSPPHLDLLRRVWNKGGPDVSIVSWITNVKEAYSVSGTPLTGILQKTGQPLKFQMRMEPKKQPLEFKLGDLFELTLNLSNGIPKRFRTRVRAKTAS